jgi:hypothetical protein
VRRDNQFVSAFWGGLKRDSPARPRPGYASVDEATFSPDFSPRLDALRGLPEGRGFSPAEIAAPAFCWSLAPRSPEGAGLRGARDTAIIKKAS